MALKCLSVSRCARPQFSSQPASDPIRELVAKWFGFIGSLDSDPSQPSRHVLPSTSQTNKQANKRALDPEKTNMQRLMAEMDRP